MRVFLTWCFFAGMVAFSPVVGQDAKEVPGVAVSEQAPDFELRDQDGKVRKLAEFVKPDQSVALVFYRSADW